MRRRLFTFAAALSLLVVLLAAAWWVRGYWKEDVFDYVTNRPVQNLWHWRMSVLHLSDGRAWLHVEEYRVADPTFADQWTQRPGKLDWNTYKVGALGPRQSTTQALGFRFQSDHTWKTQSPSAGGPDAYDLQVPWWAVVLLMLVLPLVWVVRVRRQSRRARRSLCHSCGYDLTGNTSGTCPECGTAIASRP